MVKKLTLGLICLLFGLVGCTTPNYPLLEKAPVKPHRSAYHIGPGDQVDIRVWRNQDLSQSVTVRPDGMISLPLIDDIAAAGKTPTELSNDLESSLSYYIKDPLVTVMLSKFVGTYQDSIRVVGEATQPQSIPFRDGMTVLDVMILVGGLTDFASGNRAILIRVGDHGQQPYRVRLDDLINHGDITANALMNPGDILIIPEAWI